MNKIWATIPDIPTIQAICQHTIIDHLGIEFTNIDDGSIMARMPVDTRTHQIQGVLHGGASCVLAETIGSIGAQLCVDQSQYHCVGLSIHTNHIRSISSGYVYACAKPVHIGRSTQVWEIPITNEKKQMISLSQLTVAILKYKNVQK